MAEGPLRDRYANIATFDVTESAAGTLTFHELRTNMGIDSSRKTAMAMLIDEINYFPAKAAIAEMTTSADTIRMAITVSNNVTSLNDMSDQRILHTAEFMRMDFGTAASAAHALLPFKYQFFPPLIHAERSIYLGAHCVGLASAAQIRARVYYRTVQLSEGEFIELAEIFRLVG